MSDNEGAREEAETQSLLPFHTASTQESVAGHSIRAGVGVPGLTSEERSRYILLDGQRLEPEEAAAMAAALRRAVKLVTGEECDCEK